MASQKRSSTSRSTTGVMVQDEQGAEDHCTCCQPPNPLVKRPDFGVLADGTAEYALCVLHDPEPVVYRNRGDGVYELAFHLSLNAAGEIVDDNNRLVAGVRGTEYQRLSTVDDDADDAPREGSSSSAGSESASERYSQPRTVHVDLSQDDFYL